MAELVVLPRRKRGVVRSLPWRWIRRAVQVGFLVLFFWLFRKTELAGVDELGQPVNLFFRLNPLVGACAMLASRAWIAAFLPAVGVLILTLILGRFFCGWFCPLGTLLDLAHRIFRPITRRVNRWSGAWPMKLRPVRYFVLVLVLAFASLSLPLVGYLDPFALLTRAAAFSLDPGLYRGTSAALAAADESTGRWHDFGARAEPFLRDHVLPFGDRTFLLSATALLMLATIFALELIKRRFWCRYLCPLGAMVGLVSRYSPLHRVPVKSCPKCLAAESCADTCRMDAFTEGGTFKADDCNLCMDCVTGCPDSRTAFKFKMKPGASAPVDLSRRAAIIALTTGIATPLVVKASRLGQSTTVNAALIRPPGVGNEKAFLDLCVRCGLCLKVCPTNGLQPTGLMSGIDGLFSPRLVSRMGYCESECTLCGQVCPTGAIPHLAKAQKVKTVMGKAMIDRDRCLPWATNEECICCEEHCPVDEKAIGFEEVQAKGESGEMITLKRPFIHWDRCNGCGICENKCPIDGESAIVVRRSGSVPKGEGRGGGGGRGRGRGGGRGRWLQGDSE